MLGWLTPNVADFSGSHRERSVVIPGNLFFYVTGALAMLSEEENWEQFGDATPHETAHFFLDMLEEFLLSDMRNVGMIAAFAESAAVGFGWLLMTGQTIAQVDYPELATRVPTSWLSGSNIIIPDARTRFMVGNSGTVIVGTVGGSNTHTLTTGEMPAHNHIAGITPNTAAAAAGVPIPAIVQLTNGATSMAGSGQPHNNMPAYLAVRWAIYAGR